MAGTIRLFTAGPPPGFVPATHMGQIDVIQTGGCIDNFIATVRESHDFVACEIPGNASIGACLSADPGFIPSSSPGLVTCPSQSPFAWNFISGLTVRAGSFQAVGPFALSVALSGDAGASVSSSPAGIACPSDCSESYALDTIVTLTAVPSVGFILINWTVDDPFNGPLVDAISNPLVLTVDRNWSVTANFAESIISIGEGRSRIITDNNTIVVVEAIPAPNNFLVGVSCT